MQGVPIRSPLDHLPTPPAGNETTRAWARHHGRPSPPRRPRHRPRRAGPGRGRRALGPRRAGGGRATPGWPRAPRRRPAAAAGASTRPPIRWRTCFERDRDRILHASAFRRLAGKTQVFVFPADHQRTRLTHALEVAQVAAALARALRLNVALTEAIALGHDCGHGPGGHASEAALAPYLPGGFDHAEWGADVALAPLNLCRGDARRGPQPLVVAPVARHTRGRGGRLGRSHRLCLPRLRRRGVRRGGHRRRPARHRRGPLRSAAQPADRSVRRRRGRRHVTGAAEWP